MQFAEIGGLALHYALRQGRAGSPTLVLINALGTDLRIWDTFIELLPAKLTVLRYDMRGLGLSALGDPPYSISDHVDDLAGLIARLRLDRIVVCGLSVGGLVAQGLYARQSADLRALVLCGTAHRIGTVESWNERIDAVQRGGIAAISEGIMERWFTPAFRRERGAELAGYRAMLERQPAWGYAGTCAALRDADHTEIVRRIDVPTLCLAGDHDGATPPDLVRSMAELIPGSRFEILAGAGHISCAEQPARLAELVGGMIAGVDNVPGSLP